MSETGFVKDEGKATTEKRLEVLLKMVIKNNQKMSVIIQNQQKQIVLMDQRIHELEEKIDRLDGKFDLLFDEVELNSKTLESLNEDEKMNILKELKEEMSRLMSNQLKVFEQKQTPALPVFDARLQHGHQEPKKKSKKEEEAEQNPDADRVVARASLSIIPKSRSAHRNANFRP